MKAHLPVLALLALALPATAVAAARPPAAFEASYGVLRNGSMMGEATIRFQRLPNGIWQLRSQTRGNAGLAALAGASVDENSLLRWNTRGPETINYTYQQDVAWRNRQRSLTVNPARGTAISTSNDESTPLAYQPGMLDRQAVTVALMADLAEGAQDELSYPVAERRGIGEHRFRIYPPAPLQTALGTRTAIQVERLRDTPDGRRTTIWFGVEDGYVPLRIRQVEDDGETIEMRINQLR
jgi:hypothetical protein